MARVSHPVAREPTVHMSKSVPFLGACDALERGCLTTELQSTFDQVGFAWSSGRVELSAGGLVLFLIFRQLKVILDMKFFDATEPIYASTLAFQHGESFRVPALADVNIGTL